ncbi:oxygen-independent coproporphyrinogen III oxidase [Novimethylophilus kurashikiensis]|uniref:Coproporphyrinogen-III oxidase n=1 Tax=Novimethylophilus kurashikiensis TaxID=1825523 RepID=A0A2R5F1T3_9PROT|nr:oxygen-independent coproporphyrinogen III oxidase [Novimethylophilus kurashikiensis]GBG12632.1 oxygen-independent coproporphyrinogen III oxidase [Novimethylophilus kurashikiensis]
MNFSTELLHKYCKAGPRYTSYPTAPYFHESFGPAQWEEELRASQDKGRDISLYAHIPFCDTLCYYCGCNMIATKDYSKAEAYLDVLFREIDHVAGMTSKTRTVRQLHWGGGTPTYLKPDDLRRLYRYIADRFNIAPDAEVGCEMDPRELTLEHVKALRESGFNRVSLGVQDLDDKVQHAVNRVQPEAMIREVYGWIREKGFYSVNFDLMIGLPHQTPETFERTLDKVIAMAPDRFAVFNYAHVPWMKKHQKLIVEETLPQLEQRLALQKLTLEKLTAAGYVYIGMDHFAKPDDELVKAQREKTLYRNFQGYTTHKNCDILAFGASAISQTDDVYAQNVKVLSEYRELIEQGKLPVERGLRIAPEDKLRRDVITRIMCDLELDKASFGHAWNIDFDTYFAAALNELEDMQSDGLVVLAPEKISVTEAGRVFLRNIAMAFDNYLHQQATNIPRYSKTV